ncbi:MAG TPA: glycerophosphodiester phosphodiesterase family protein, partial [Pseudomonadales bacterium]
TENTLPAFRAAAAAGADAAELDVRATRDGVFVVLHDARVDRTTLGRGRVARLSAEQIGRLATPDGLRIPELGHVLDGTAGLGLTLVLDLKAARLDLERLVELISAHGRLGDVVFGVRSLADLRRLNAIRPGLHRLAFPKRPAQVDAYLDAGVDVIRVWPQWLTRDPALADRARAAGVDVWLTTEDAPVEQLAAWAQDGIGGFITDRPAEAAAAFACAGEP